MRLRAATIALLVALAVDTRLLTTPSGVQAGLIDPLWRWTSDLARGTGALAPALLLVIDGGTLILAATGLADYRRHPRLVRALATWLVVSIALAALVRQPDLRYLLQPFAPAALLAGLGLRRLLDAVCAGGDIRSTTFALAAMVPILAAAFRVNIGLRSGQEPWGAAALLVMAGLALVAIVAIRTLDSRQCAAALATVLLIATTTGAIATTSRLLEARGSARAQLLDAAVLTDEIHTVRTEVLTWERQDPATPIPVDPTLRPLVAWALRDVKNLEYDSGAASREGRRLLAAAPTAISPSSRATRLILGYDADRRTLEPRPDRIWGWIVGRQSFVEVRPRAILVVRPAGA